jgi:hypothetical protein
VLEGSFNLHAIAEHLLNKHIETEDIGRLQLLP